MMFMNTYKFEMTNEKLSVFISTLFNLLWGRLILYYFSVSIITMPMTLFLQDMADKKTSFKHDLSVKRPSLSISPLKNKNEIFTPVTSNKTPKDLKSSLEATIPNCLIKVPLRSKTWSELKISWDVIPPSINDLAKVCSHALITASAYMMESSYCLCVLTLSDSGSCSSKECCIFSGCSIS